MSIQGPKHAATEPPALPSSQRRTFLDVLGLDLQRRYGLRSGIVLREGVTVLFAVDGSTMRTVEICCDLTADGWWFSWADDGRTFAAVEGARDAAEVVVRHLRGNLPGLS